MTVTSSFVAPLPEAFPGSKHLNGVKISSTEVSSDSKALNGNKGDVDYKIKEQWHSQPRHLRIIHAGAGAAGLLMAYKMQKDFEDYSLVCYEKYG